MSLVARRLRGNGDKARTFRVQSQLFTQVAIDLADLLVGCSLLVLDLGPFVVPAELYRARAKAATALEA